LDPPRESPEAARSILQTLDEIGLHWDGSVLYQSQRLAAYQQGLKRLAEQELIFYCKCTRKDVQANGGIYPGTCRKRRQEPAKGKFAIRCLVDERTISFEDLYQGSQSIQMQQVGDFVIRRKDGLFAYQLAVVMDDAWQGISHVIRGIDLLDSSPRQLYLQQVLGLASPVYGHIPVIVNQQGQKLSKQHFAKPVDGRDSQKLLLQALAYLQQEPDPALAGSSNEEILHWAIAHWKPENFRGMREITEFVPTD
ncbi:MAG: tRNA glutamyl-Q(34) synthetase GluQRS, partial [Pseudohongiellaceae bacterium]